MKKINFNEYIKNHTLRLEASHRGGGIEIDASEFIGIPGAKMSAYQNYLGGGMLGSINSSRNYNGATVESGELEDALKKYYHNITNEEAGDMDEWSAGDFESIQARPESAY